MADLMNSISSLFRKLKPAQRAASLNSSSPAVLAEKQPSEQETLLRTVPTLSEVELKEFVVSQPERNLVRLIQAIADPVLQLRIVQQVTDEATLKRISRSEFSAKLKRTALKRLRETGAGGSEQRLQRLERLSFQVQSFLSKPLWQDAQEVLDLVSTTSNPDLAAAELEVRSAQFKNFDELRGRFKREYGEYQKTCAEMESICSQLAPARPLSPSSLTQLQSRWKDLEEKYTFPKKFGLFEIYRRHLLERSAPRPASVPVQKSVFKDSVPSIPLASASPVEAPREDPAKKFREEQSRVKRFEAIKNLLHRLQDCAEKLTHRQTASVLKELQSEATALRRWKREYPTELGEAEKLLKELSSKRSEAVDEARWDSWARTDLAVRMQTELEKIISEIESEPDLETALRKSAGMTQKLFDCSKDMRELGSLERGKDHKIWEQFKSLSERGWVICDKMRTLLLEQLQASLSGLASKPLDFSVSALSTQRLTLDLKASSYEAEPAARIKELQSLWREIGARPSKQNHEAEIVGTRLFEIYFRQLNLHFGKLKRVETGAIQKKREVLNEMRVACEGKSSLLARTCVARSLEERWERVPMPNGVAVDFATEFESYQARLRGELVEEVNKQAEIARGIQTLAQAALEKVLAKNGASLSQALKHIGSLEAELAGIEKQLAQFNGLGQELEDSFKIIQKRITEIFSEVRSAVARETAERVLERDLVIREAEALAISSDWGAAQPRVEELRAIWKKVGVTGQSQDEVFDALLHHVTRFFAERAANRERTLDSYDPKQRDQFLSKRKELLYSLDALMRFQEGRKGITAALSLTLPLSEAERAESVGKVLARGLKYRHILALDPIAGTVKETRKVMDEWVRVGGPDEESLPAFWAYYLERVHALLGWVSG